MKKLFSLALLFIATNLMAQSGDRSFIPKNKTQTFSADTAPIVLIDEAHHNFHTINGRYQAFANVLRSDGYKVKANTKAFNQKHLAAADVLVISNALHAKNEENWDLPNYSAFTRDEVEEVYQWVKGGGSLFLIADHMPFPKAAEDLAAIFGFQFNNGYVEDKKNDEQIFSLEQNNLQPHAIVNGMQANHAVTKVKAFTGQAFISPPTAKPLLVFGKSAVTLMPKRSWKFPDDVPELSVAGWHQGATLEFGKGRIVVFGEAAMFTAQNSHDMKMGLAADGAEQNEQFLLNIMHWLSGKI